MALPNVDLNERSKNYRGQFDSANWVSLMESLDIIQPEVRSGLVKRTGMADTLFAMLDLAKMTIPVKSFKYRVYEQGDLDNAIIVGESGVTGGAGAGDLIYIHLDSGCLGNNGNLFPVAPDDGVLITSKFAARDVTPQGGDPTYERRDLVYVVTEVNKTTRIVTAKPLDGKAVIKNTIPVGTLLKVHSYYGIRGGDQNRGIIFDLFKREYETQIIKTSFEYEGGVDVIEIIPILKDGIMRQWIKGQEKAELVHNKKIDDALFISQLNTNNLTGTSKHGNTNPYLSTMGLWDWAMEAGNIYTRSSTFSKEFFYDIKDYLRVNNITSTEVLCLMGGGFKGDLERLGLNLLGQYSGGTNLLTVNKLGIDLQYMQFADLLFAFKTVASFDNPLRYGGDDSDFYNRALLYPVDTTYVTNSPYGGGTPELSPTLLIGYLENNGISRRRVVRFIDGMTGREADAKNTWDVSGLYILTEFMSIVLAPNKLVPVINNNDTKPEVSGQDINLSIGGNLVVGSIGGATVDEVIDATMTITANSSDTQPAIFIDAADVDILPPV